MPRQATAPAVSRATPGPVRVTAPIGGGLGRARSVGVAGVGEAFGGVELWHFHLGTL